ncbi:HYC_CC_PP family protein [Pedobacter caeni]|uniref:Uncharacterized protein n=1 Tax=Pedobacter caeni TaxID=288992 RepID=A0A1M5DRF6_9SPHI|nr:hypothetical protein [Pedobacter caeni]SHF69441.1 hypothetical protein SAMN04488522_103348 [Pedobacter caeni]
MKRLFSLFLCTLFLTVSTGFTASAHFCKGIKQEIRLFPDDHQNKVCPVCVIKSKQKTKKDNCCKHEKEQIKLTEKVEKIAQQQSLFKFSGETALYHPPLPAFDWTAAAVEQNVPAFDFSSPKERPALYILHCVYRI